MKLRSKEKQKGFTVIELVIVIVVVIVLAGIVVSTYSGIQTKSRNSKRETAIESIQNDLEAFYSQNGYYPSLKDVNGTAWRQKNMPDLNASTMIDPSSKMNSSDVKLAASPAPKVYSYKVTDSNGSSCENDDTNCAKYTLTATFEGKVNGSKTYEKQNID